MLKAMLERFKKNKEAKVEENKEIERALTPKESIILSPSAVVERGPRESNATNYWVELGDNTGGAKYLRSWFARLTGRTTWVGMFEPAFVGASEGEVDITYSIEPVDISIEMQRMSQRIAILRADLMTTTNPVQVGDMTQELHDLEQQMGRLRVNAEKLYRTSIVMTTGADDPDKLRKLSRSIIKRMAAMGIMFRAADTRQLEAFRYSIGLGNRANFDDIYLDMESSNAADSFLFGYGGLSHRNGVLLGMDHRNRPVFYDGWNRKLANQHMVVFGRAGSGKSFAVKVLTRRSALYNIKTGIIDPDREYKNLVLAMGGAYAELSPKEEVYHRINIYDVEAEEDENGRIFVNLEEARDAVKAVLFKMIRLIDESALTGQVKVAIEDTSKELYKNFKITHDPASLYEVDKAGNKVRKPMPTLYDHYLLMKQHPDLKIVSEFIKLFTRDNGGDISKSIFDGQSTFQIGDSQVFGISVADLEEEWMKPLGLFIATKWVWEKFGKKNRINRKRIIVDEAQLMMEQPEQARWLENAYRRGRKLNVSMCAATQGFEVFLRVKEGMGILKNAPTKLLMRQETVDIDAVTEDFGLAEGEAKFLLTAPPGVGILKVDEESSIVKIQATPQEYWLYTTNPNDLGFQAKYGR